MTLNIILLHDAEHYFITWNLTLFYNMTFNINLLHDVEHNFITLHWTLFYQMTLNIITWLWTLFYDMALNIILSPAVNIILLHEHYLIRQWWILFYHIMLNVIISHDVAYFQSNVTTSNFFLLHMSNTIWCYVI